MAFLKNTVNPGLQYEKLHNFGLVKSTNWKGELKVFLELLN